MIGGRGPEAPESVEPPVQGDGADSHVPLPAEGVGRGTIVHTVFRSFLIQGSWNYHSMLGSGFAFTLLPGLRRLHGPTSAAFDEAVRRHLELFNAHPYLSSVALGATLRLEADRADPETVRRFKVAVRGPLGSLGDALVWATWLPGVAVTALALYWLGAPPWLAVAAFLVLYNAGHIGLRVWGMTAGFRAGRDVAAVLGRADLGGWTARFEPVVVLLLGIMVGTLLGGEEGLRASGAVWTALASLAFVAGLLGGHRTWRPAAIGTVIAITTIAIWGMLT